MECIHFILDWNKMAVLMECSSSIVMPWVRGRREEGEMAMDWLGIVHVFISNQHVGER